MSFAEGELANFFNLFWVMNFLLRYHSFCRQKNQCLRGNKGVKCPDKYFLYKILQFWSHWNKNWLQFINSKYNFAELFLILEHKCNFKRVLSDYLREIQIKWKEGAVYYCLGELSFSFEIFHNYTFLTKFYNIYLESVNLLSLVNILNKIIIL